MRRSTRTAPLVRRRAVQLRRAGRRSPEKRCSRSRTQAGVCESGCAGFCRSQRCVRDASDGHRCGTSAKSRQTSRGPVRGDRRRVESAAAPPWALLLLRPRCALGQNCWLHPRVTLYAGAQLKDRVEVHSGAVIGARRIRLRLRRSSTSEISPDRRAWKSAMTSRSAATPRSIAGRSTTTHRHRRENR